MLGKGRRYLRLYMPDSWWIAMISAADPNAQGYAFRYVKSIIVSPMVWEKA